MKTNFDKVLSPSYNLLWLVLLPLLNLLLQLFRILAQVRRRILQGTVTSSAVVSELVLVHLPISWVYQLNLYSLVNMRPHTTRWSLRSSIVVEDGVYLCSILKRRDPTFSYQFLDL